MMELIIGAFNELLYRPLFNFLVFLYNVIPGNDLGVAIIVLTLLIRIVLYAPSQKAIKSQKALAELQPKIKEIQEKHKDNKEAQTKAIMQFYQQNKINPLSGCLPLLIQFPILIALYRVFWKTGADPTNLNGLYPFVANPGSIDPIFLNFIDLSKPGSSSPESIALVLLAGLAQFFQSKMMTPARKSDMKEKRTDFSQAMQTQMVYFMPIFTVFILWRFSTGLALYWLITSLFSIGQQFIASSRKINDTETS